MLTKRSSWMIAIVISTLLAAWPHWVWMLKRAQDGSDEPWGMVALATIIGLLARDSSKLRQPSDFRLTITALLMLCANITWGVLPPIFATAFAVLGVGWLLAGLLPANRPSVPLLVMALLTLPLTASLNFYLGYPLRWLCAQAVAPLLALLGLTVSPQGTALFWNGKSILIDAPCAGIAMLWLGFYLAALFSYLNAASWRRCVVNLGLAVVTVIVANILRNSLLFYKESGIVQLPNWTHEGIGLLVFAMLVLTLYQLTSLNVRTGGHHGQG